MKILKDAFKFTNILKNKMNLLIGVLLFLVKITNIITFFF